MILSNILSIIAPYFLTKETKLLRGSSKQCSIEAQCDNFKTCNFGKCVPYMSESVKYDFPIDRYMSDLYWDCLDDIEISEAFFYNSYPKYMRTYVNKLGISIMYYRKRIVTDIALLERWKFLLHKNTARRIDIIKDTDVLVAFCPIN